MVARSHGDVWNTTGVQTAEALRALAASNSVVAAEYKTSNELVGTGADVNVAAASSARALSGYGIAVAERAFVDCVEVTH